MFTREMQRALKADAEKLGLMTGDEHGVEFYNTCPLCDGEGGIEVPRPQHDDPYYCDVIKCADCNGSGWMRMG